MDLEKQAAARRDSLVMVLQDRCLVGRLTQGRYMDHVILKLSLAGKPLLQFLTG